MTETAQNLGQLYRQYAPVVYRRALSILENEADALDAVQDVFVKLNDKLAGFRGDASVMTWIYSVTTNHCLNVLRSRGTRRRAAETLQREPAPAPVDYAARVEGRELWGELARDLSERQVQVLIHSFVDEMTQPEVANLLGISERAVRKLLTKARERAGLRLQALERAHGEAP